MFNRIFLLALSAALSALLAHFNAITMGAAILLVLLPAFLARPGLYFNAFILARPAIDIASNYKLPGGINLAAASTIVLIFVCGAMLLSKEGMRGIRSNKFLSVFNKLFSLFLFYCLFSVINSPDKISALTDFLRLLSILAAVNYAAVYYRNKESFLRLLKLIAVSAAIPLAFGIYQLALRRGVSDAGFNRLFGTFLHPNVFAQFLVLIFFILFYFLANFRLRLRAKLLAYPLFLLVVLELFFTYTRGAWIALFAGLSLGIFIKTKTSVKLKFLLLGALIMLLAFPYIQKRFSDINVKDKTNLSSWQWRLQQWTGTLESLKEHPLLGNGLGEYERSFKIMAHNDYLRIGFETGFFGLLSYISVLTYILLLSFKKLLKCRIPAECNNYKAALALIASLIIMSMADNLARSTMILLYMFVSAGCFLTVKSDPSHCERPTCPPKAEGSEAISSR